MEAVPIRRWAPGFVAMRWRHVFWLLPLAGLLVGLGIQLQALYGPTATGLLLARPIPISSARTVMKDASEALQSDEILSRTIASLDLKNRWGIEPDACISKLREMIRSKQIPGTSLIEVWVSGGNRGESVEIWNTLALHFNQHFADKRIAAEIAKLAPLKATVETLERDLDEKRRRLSDALGKKELLLLAPGSPADEAKEAEITRLKADFEAARKALEKAQIDLLSSEMGCRLLENPVIVHEAPALPPPLIHRDTLRALFQYAGIGLSIGVVLTAPLAYLLELLFPRRRPIEPAGT